MRCVIPPNLNAIIESFRDHTYTPTKHVAIRMIERNIAAFRLEDAIGDDEPEIIADYPEDSRGASCLILGYTKTGQPLHARIGYSSSVPVLISAYDPRTQPYKWSDDFRRRITNGNTS